MSRVKFWAVFVIEEYFTWLTPLLDLSKTVLGILGLAAVIGAVFPISFLAALLFVILVLVEKRLGEFFNQ